MAVKVECSLGVLVAQAVLPYSPSQLTLGTFKVTVIHILLSLQLFILFSPFLILNDASFPIS